MADFRTAFLRTLAFEDDPAHPGRVTPEPHGARARLGVNSAAHPEMPDSFWTCPYAEALPYAERIFRLYYWDGLKLDSVDSQDAANKIYDMAVNMGGGTAVKLLQVALGVKVDGRVGAFTLRAVNSTDTAGLVQKLRDASAERYRHLAEMDPDEYAGRLSAWLVRAAK